MPTRAGLAEVHVKNQHHNAANVAVVTAESVRTTKPGNAIQTSKSIAKFSTGTL